jgi:integrase
MAKKTLTDRTLAALANKPAPKGKTYDVADSVVPGLGVRVSETGRRTFTLTARFPGSNNPTRRSIGVYDLISLEKARTTAREWIELMGKGTDPAIQAERQRQTELQKRKNTFAAVVADFTRDKLAGERHGYECGRDLRNVFLPMWGDRPITDISEDDVVGFLQRWRRRSVSTARQHHALLCRFFRWTKAQRVYGLKVSPCADIDAKMIGEKAIRTRVLTNIELRAVWTAAERTPYPYGEILKLLALTGCRRAEVAEARWSEFDLEQKLWTIPAERMKGQSAHTVPLTDDMISILESLPRLAGCDLLFTVAGKVINGFTRAAKRLNVDVLAALREQAGADVKLERWTLHDIRRTMRTGLSGLPISDLVRELVIAHAKPGLHKVYDMHAYEAEKRQALEMWGARLRSIVTPPPANVVKMPARATVKKFPGSTENKIV